jgi:hypothetical protein
VRAENSVGVLTGNAQWVDPLGGGMSIATTARGVGPRGTGFRLAENDQITLLLALKRDLRT